MIEGLGQFGPEIARRHGIDPNFQRRPYDKWKAYGQSKSANALFAVGLDARGEGHGIRAFSLHPGSILTDLARDLTEDDLRALGVSKGDAQGHVPAGRSASEGGDFKTLAQGAATAVWCATSPQLVGMGGVYCENVEVSPVTASDQPGPGVRPWAVDRELAGQLWALSERLTDTSL